MNRDEIKRELERIERENVYRMTEMFDHTDLPWNEVRIPPAIRPGKFGDWEIVEDTPPVARGYFRGLQSMEDRRNWVLRKKDTVWMSVTPMELESMSPHVDAATGKVVVVGGGLGVYVYNVLAKKDVREVVLIEKDLEVCRLLERHLHIWSWHGAEKLTILRGIDAMDIDIDHPANWCAGRPDFLYVDIWSELGDKRTVPMTQIIQAIIDARQVAFWSMELEFIHWCGVKKKSPPPTGWDWREWVESTGLPLNSYVDVAYWSLVAAEQVTNY